MFDMLDLLGAVISEGIIEGREPSHYELTSPQDDNGETFTTIRSAKGENLWVVIKGEEEARRVQEYLEKLWGKPFSTRIIDTNTVSRMMRENVVLLSVRDWVNGAPLWWKCEGMDGENVPVPEMRVGGAV